MASNQCTNEATSSDKDPFDYNKLRVLWEGDPPSPPTRGFGEPLTCWKTILYEGLTKSRAHMYLNDKFNYSLKLYHEQMRNRLRLDPETWGRPVPKGQEGCLGSRFILPKVLVKDTRQNICPKCLRSTSLTVPASPSIPPKYVPPSARLDWGLALAGRQQQEGS